MRNVIAFLNMKGGVCKTSLCKEIGLYLAEQYNKNKLSKSSIRQFRNYIHKDK